MAYYPNNPNGQTTMANSAPVVIASDQSPVSINISSDVFEHVVVGSRYNQVEVNFSQTDPDLIPDITVTKVNGGDASNSSGQSVFSSGTNTNGGVSAVSNSLVYYNPHFETFAAFSAIFTTGIANSYQRIGLYDVNNGFFIGYNNTIFGVTLRKGGLDTFIGQASFNVDTLTGAPTSTFKRNGVPEAVDFTKDNLYRIRFGWLGAAPIFFEIYSPDGDWVVFNVIRHPNSSTSASINNPDLPVTLDIQKTGAGATNLVMSSGCWGAGTTSDLKKLSDTLTDNSLAKTVKSVLAAKDAGGNYINIGATLTGNLETAIAEVGAGVTFPITDNGGSITVDGTVAATQSGAWTVGVNNAGGASAVNIQDGGNSITVDGSVAATQSGTWNINNISGTVSLPTGAATESTLSTLNGKIPSNLTVTSTRLLVDGSGVTQPISGTVTANAGTGTFVVAQATAANLNATVTGSVSVSNFPATQPVSGTVAATQSGAWSVDVNNGAGASAVNIQDGGNSITVDGSVSVSNFPATQPVSGTVSANLNAGTNYVGKVRLTDGTTDAEVVPLAGFNAQAVAIVDGSGNQVTSFGGGTQYADGTAVATPTGTVSLGFDGSNVQAISTDALGQVNVVQGSGSALNADVALKFINSAGNPIMQSVTGGIDAICTVSFGTDGVSYLPLITDASGVLNTVGNVAHDSPDSGNPIKIGYQAETALPTAVANGDRANGISDRYGRQLVNQIDPGMQVWKSAEYTSTQTGANIWVPTAGRRFVITSLHIATGGSTAGLVTIWGAQTATTAYTPGTDQVFFRGVLTPTANATPGALIQPSHPFFSDTTNDCLKITTSANMTVYIQVNGYEITP